MIKILLNIAVLITYVMHTTDAKDSFKTRLHCKHTNSSWKCFFCTLPHSTFFRNWIKYNSPNWFYF